MATTTHLMTAEELAKLPDDGHVYELSRGRLICMSPSGTLSSIIAGKVLVRLGVFVDRERLGLYGTAEGGFTLARQPDTVRAPDVWFVRAERIPGGGIPITFWPGAPDLAIEVLSPSDRFGAVLEKVRDYIDAGTRLVWVIDPESRSAGVFRPHGPVQFIDEPGALDGEDVLPGFSLPLCDVLP